MRIALFLVLTLVVVAACNKQTETYPSDSVADYLPLQTGKYITYRLDSTVFTNFGITTEVHSYQEKNVVDAQITDAAGKPSYRILRYLRAANASATDGWSASGSYFVTLDSNKAEVVENNLRIIKLSKPVVKHFSWKGNSYLAPDPYSSIYNFDNDKYMPDWDYTYTGVGETTNINGKPYNNVIIVQAIADSINVPITVPAAYARINKSIDQYSKGLGLINQELTMWEYQPNGRYMVGFGVKRSIIDHN
ncbi:MAG: hypothetical protein ACM3VS_00920 [Candidatus Dadabacteria bacterium]